MSKEIEEKVSSKNSIDSEPVSSEVVVTNEQVYVSERIVSALMSSVIEGGSKMLEQWSDTTMEVEKIKADVERQKVKEDSQVRNNIISSIKLIVVVMIVAYCVLMGIAIWKGNVDTVSATTIELVKYVGTAVTALLGGGFLFTRKKEDKKDDND